MPPDMFLRSDWTRPPSRHRRTPARSTLFVAEAGEQREEPIPLQKFLRYSEWFRQKFVGESDPADVRSLERADGRFRLVTEAGDEVDARKVVIAVGAMPFPFAPPSFAPLLGDGVSYATDPHDFETFRGRRVVVVGGGQGGLESAAFAARAGADVELLVRSQLRWFADREPHKPRSPLGQRLYRLAYPIVGYGPPPLNRLVLHPDLFASLPKRARRALARRGPARRRLALAARRDRARRARHRGRLGRVRRGRRPGPPAAQRRLGA